MEQYRIAHRDERRAYEKKRQARIMADPVAREAMLEHWRWEREQEKQRPDYQARLERKRARQRREDQRDRAIVRAVRELGWLDGILVEAGQ
jgi:hypothetical protein